MARKKKLRLKCAADEYAAAVLDGDIVAGPGIRGAAARHFRDLDNKSKSFPYVWDMEKAEKICRFFETQLRLSIGETDGQLFQLLPWQSFYLQSIFGWVHKETGLRRFRTVYLETSKSSGK